MSMSNKMQGWWNAYNSRPLWHFESAQGAHLPADARGEILHNDSVLCAHWWSIPVKGAGVNSVDWIILEKYQHSKCKHTWNRHCGTDDNLQNVEKNARPFLGRHLFLCESGHAQWSPWSQNNSIKPVKQNWSIVLLTCNITYGIFKWKCKELSSFHDSLKPVYAALDSVSPLTAQLFAIQLIHCIICIPVVVKLL